MHMDSSHLLLVFAILAYFFEFFNSSLLCYSISHLQGATREKLKRSWSYRKNKNMPLMYMVTSISFAVIAK